MTACFIALTLASALSMPGPVQPILVNRAAIQAAWAPMPADPQRPSARAVLRLSGTSVVYVTQAPAEVVGAPCIER